MTVKHSFINKINYPHQSEKFQKSF